jgi:hypothetical protein
MTHSLICLFVSVSTLWIAPETDVLQTELAPFIKEASATGVPAKLFADASTGSARFEETIDILRRTSAPIKNYLDRCDTLAWKELPFAQALTLPQTPLNVHVGEGQTNYLFGALRYYLALRLVQARLFDEAKQVLEELTPENSIDPAGVLLTKAIVFHHFSEKEKGLAALNEFQAVAKRETVSRRSTELAKLLQFEWDKRSRENDPEVIARQMDDVRRRLGKERTGDDTQDVEDGVLKALDELIEKIESQCKKCGGQCEGQCQGQGGQGNKPAEDSYRLTGKGPGNVDRREFSSGDNWGDLPPKEREEALLSIEKEFPAYYRDIIEQYFREMAK